MFLRISRSVLPLRCLFSISVVKIIPCTSTFFRFSYLHLQLYLSTICSFQSYLYWFYLLFSFSLSLFPRSSLWRVCRKASCLAVRCLTSFVFVFVLQVVRFSFLFISFKILISCVCPWAKIRGLFGYNKFNLKDWLFKVCRFTIYIFQITYKASMY